MAPWEIGSFTISPMFCYGYTALLFVCRGPGMKVCVRATFDRFRSAQKRFYNSCVHISWRFIPAALPRVRLRKRLFFLFALSHFLASFFFPCFSLPAHTHTHTLAFILKCMRGNEARSAGQKTMTPVSALLEDASDALAFNRRLYHYYFFASRVVRERKLVA